MARVLAQIPEPRRHLVRYYGRYSNVARGKRKRARQENEMASLESAAAQPEPTPGEVSSLRRRWAQLIRRVYEIDPLVCPKCGSEMKMIVITEARVIRRIVDHLMKRAHAKRGPPAGTRRTG